MLLKIITKKKNNSKGWKNGVSVAKYLIWTDLFNMNIIDNQCYCFKGRSLDDCNGFNDCSGTFDGLSFAITLPHFIGSSNLARNIHGLKPNYKKHLTIFYLEQYLGIPMDVQLTFQFNWPLHYLPRIGSLSNIRPCILPFGWFRGVSIVYYK